MAALSVRLPKQISAFCVASVVLAAAGPALGASEKVLYSFNGDFSGAYPQAGLIHVGGTLYGTTGAYGPYSAGTVFKVTLAGAETLVSYFQAGGAYPTAGLIGVGGTLYGTTPYSGVGGASANCGTNGCGTVFAVTPAGAQSVVHAFAGGKHGERPLAGLLNVGGKLYGTTALGGDAAACSSGCGTVFEVSPAGGEHVVYQFQAGRDGTVPEATLINVGGTLYGTTTGGGGSANCPAGCGTVFAVTRAGVETVLHAFQGGSDGSLPLAGLIDVGGTLYGTTVAGGTYNRGTVFSVTLARAESVLHSFGRGHDGSGPEAGLINVGGTLYGTTSVGGAYRNGTVFKISPAGTETVVYQFQPGIGDGSTPEASLIDVGGTLYGTTLAGGAYGYGTVFALTRGQ